MFGQLKIAFAGLICIFVWAVPATTHAQFDFFQDSCRRAPNSPACIQKRQQQASGVNPVLDIIKAVANVVAAITGVAAIVMIILGALNLITSGGNAETLAKGRKRIIYSLVGVVVVALAWTITRLITDRVIQ